ncbi:NAD(P)-binding protein [Phenylobacterium sp.]|jgi:spermidine dehydrogenase|uniref:NAD(P)-binding protein n=1 Tax=Phenylobacterium sp. TaxID=1871053 RepID=UPI003784D084
MDGDRNLGMDRQISRRDFVHGAAAGALALGLPGAALAQGAGPGGGAANETYPPAKTGMRGSHPGAFESAHALRDGTLDIGAARDVDQTYDLVVVGGGLSGLAAAHFFLKDVGKDVRVLILENHDDFGGHAKRNEFRVDGKLVVINGGTLNIESPERYNRWARQVLDDIGVDLHRYEKANEENDKLYASRNLKPSYFFDKQTWGRDRLVVNDGPRGRGIAPETIAKTPLSAKAKADMLRLIGPNQPDYFPGLTPEQKMERLAKISYRDYLLNVVKVDPQVVWFYQTSGHGTFCVGADATPALFSWASGAPGFGGLGLQPLPGGLFADLPGGHHGRQREGGHSVHFPDGNATVARLLVKTLIPDAVEGSSQEDMGLAKVDYGKLDQDGQAVRIRLNSTVVNVRHDGDAATAKEALVSYINRGQLSRVRAKAVVMACWNMVIPYMVPELPEAQREALAYGVKGPIIYTNVALRNWRAWDKLGVSRISSPTSFHESCELTEAASLGGLHHARTPDDPIALHLVKVMTKPGLPRRDQHRIGRAELLETSFETFERNIRSELARQLGAGGFDPARDIAGITVNRWPHGYAYTYNSLYDPMEWVFTKSENRPCVVGRQPYGLITIANSDAAASPHTDAAFLEAHRAVSEVIEKRTYPFARI